MSRFSSSSCSTSKGFSPSTWARRSSPASRYVRSSVERFGQSAELAASSLDPRVVCGEHGVGLWAAIVTDGGAHRKLDGAFTAITGILASTAPYVSGTLLVFVFAVELKWLPVAGNAQPDAIILPALAVSIVPMATVARFARAETTRVLQEPYIRERTVPSELKPWSHLPEARSPQRADIHVDHGWNAFARN